MNTFPRLANALFWAGIWFYLGVVFARSDPRLWAMLWR